VTILIEINVVTVILAAAFLFPMVAGLFEPFTRERLHHSLVSLLDNVEFLIGLILSVYLTKRIFFENSGTLYQQLYELIPANIRAALYGKDILTYLLAVPVILLLLLVLLRIVTTPLYRYVLLPVSDAVFSGIYRMNGGVRRILGALWSLPKALFYVAVCSLLLNFGAYSFTNPILSRWMNESSIYQLLYDKALYPALNSNIAKQVPVLLNDSFRQSIGSILPVEGEVSVPELPGKPAEQSSRGNIRVIEYFNGVTLDEAIKSNQDIDEMALKIVGKEKDSEKKAYLLYKWVSTNVRYDYEKAVAVSKNAKGISSGSIIAFKTRKGICFDYSCLYISMCRAVGVKVRLITGLGYSGISWGDHAWNQVYSVEEKRWIQVDTTFGSAGNYFDKKDFNVDHKYAEVQGEW
jgi:hypothetical protein